jgi:uncharacterized protein YndB with AHSA1/START domain
VRPLLPLLLLLVGCAHNSVARDVATWEARGASVLRASATIDAPPAVVWDVLTNIDAYREWNPWLIEARGEAVPGGGVLARVVLDGKERRADHRVLHVDPPHRFCWRDHGWTTAFAYGQRCRYLEASDTGTAFRQQLLIAGPFRGTAMKRFGAAMQAGMDAETEALKARAEALARDLLRIDR